MKQALLVVAIVLLMVAILIYPFKVKGLLYFNLFDEMVCVVVTAFKIKLLNERLRANDEGKFSVEKGKKEKKKDSALLTAYFVSLAKKIDVDRVAIFFECGKSDDACFSSLACGTFNIVTGVLYHFLYSAYGNVKFLTEAKPVYEQDVMELTARLVIRFSLLDMLRSVIHAYIEYFKVKEVKNGK